MESEDKRNVLHNAKFDAHVLYAEGIILRNIVMDTMVTMWVLNKNKMRYNPETSVNRYAEHIGIKPTENAFATLFGKATFDTIDLKIALVYAAEDTELTYKLYEFLNEHLKRELNLDI